MRILGIESSCDETAAAVYDSERGLLSHAIHSQIKMHQEYGGVVPELASRDHVRKILPIVDEVLKQANSSRQDITAIAYTAGPGLLGALMVGACFAKSLAWAWGIPSIGVHHLEAHLLAPLLEEHAPDYPFVALLVSGGHTQIMQVDGFGQYKLLGETLDDAVGEAFDKTAKLMGMEYPGGPKLAKLAEQGDPARFNFPRPMVNRPGMDFSFSGLKTFALNTWQSEQPQTDDLEKLKADIARAFQDAVVDTLCIKSKRALEQTGFSRLVVAGGVSANVNLRQQLNHLARKMQVEVFYPRHEFCTDNAAMVALTGYQRLLHGAKPDTELRVRARWPLTECDQSNN